METVRTPCPTYTKVSPSLLCHSLDEAGQQAKMAPLNLAIMTWCALAHYAHAHGRHTCMHGREPMWRSHGRELRLFFGKAKMKKQNETQMACAHPNLQFFTPKQSTERPEIFVNFANSAILRKLVFSEDFLIRISSWSRAGLNLRKMVFTNQENLWFRKICSFTIYFDQHLPVLFKELFRPTLLISKNCCLRDKNDSFALVVGWVHK